MSPFRTAAPELNLDEYSFDNDVPTAVIDHMVAGCGWRHRCDGDTVEQLLDEIERHHKANHGTPDAGAQ